MVSQRLLWAGLGQKARVVLLSPSSPVGGCLYVPPTPIDSNYFGADSLGVKPSLRPLEKSTVGHVDAILDPHYVEPNPNNMLSSDALFNYRSTTRTAMMHYLTIDPQHVELRHIH